MTALPAPLAAALAARGYGALTSVQSAVLEPAVAGRDMLVSAQTGSGKTVAFGLAMAEALLAGGETLPPPDTPRALIVAPTRELALQVRRELEWLYEQAGAVIASCVGGMDIRTERRALERGAHIVVGTPGRLRDHLERASLDASLIATVVLDEADEMLDLGFREDLEHILESLPTERRTLMFSATVSDGIERLARTFQRDAQRVATAQSHEAHADIAYRALMVAPEDAENAIVNVLRFHEARNALVFCKTRAMVNHLTARLLNRGFAVVPLSGELAQDERARALQAMRDGRARVCVATDVAARGIDLPGLELVVHADLPTNAETLLHRSGRTGRAGRKGTSALIVPLRARRRTERLIAEAGVTADWGPAPTAADVSARDTERLFTDPALTAPETAEEHALITALIERFTPRELAAAVVRQYFAARSAPEDIAAVTDTAPKPRDRASFERSFWVRLGVGRAARAEPRWLLPMLCRAGDLTRDDIGAIRIFDDETLVQIHADAEARFFNAMGEEARLERDIAVTRSAPPVGGPRPAARPGKAPEARTPARSGKHDGQRPERGPRPRRDEAETPHPAQRSERAAPAGRVKPPQAAARSEAGGDRSGPATRDGESRGMRGDRAERPARAPRATRDDGKAPRDRKDLAPRGADTPPLASKPTPRGARKATPSPRPPARTAPRRSTPRPASTGPAGNRAAANPAGVARPNRAAARANPPAAAPVPATGASPPSARAAGELSAEPENGPSLDHFVSCWYRATN
jgi:ATP-dependent RNA helicase DeaD